MSRQTSSQESRERGYLIAKLRRLHGTIDRLRCDETIQNEDLDVQFDEMLELLDEVIVRLPAIERTLRETRDEQDAALCREGVLS